MTLTEAIDRRFTRLRRDPWNEYAHIELHIVGDTMAVHARLRDVGAEVLVSVLEMEEEGWEVWEPPADVGRMAECWPTYRG